MAEAEDVLVDVARHGVSWVQRRLSRPANVTPGLADVAPRLDVLLRALHGRPIALLPAQAPAPRTLLARWWRWEPARPTQALPGTDGTSLWLPGELSGVPAVEVPLLYRAMALQQALRAARGSPGIAAAATPVERDILLMLESLAVEAALLQALPGLRLALQRLRAVALERRPPTRRLASACQVLEAVLRPRLLAPLTAGTAPPAAQLLAEARALAQQLGNARLHKDWWTGEWRQPEPGAVAKTVTAAHEQGDKDANAPLRSARLLRRPKVRQAEEGEDDAESGAWMVQTAQPHEKAEDPAGLQRPTDHDTQESAQSHAQSLAELEAARLVRMPQRAHEVLLSDDPLPLQPAPPSMSHTGDERGLRFNYPEWDDRQQRYRRPGATVWVRTAEAGSPDWVRATLRRHHALLQGLVKRFELLRTQRLRLRGQVEGDDIDLDALVQARADFRAGLPLSPRIYCSQRLLRRDLACVLLIDISGSTDSWLAGQRRVIDVEREGLLLLALALQQLGEPHALLAFSGRGAGQVQLWQLKAFDEPGGEAVAARIAGLEPQHCTRTGAAMRHASWLLSQRPEHHKLLLLLSDGKPQDDDGYEGRIAVQDLRHAVQEVRALGQYPFALTVERQAAAWMPKVFPPGHWGLLQQPERLPLLLLQWLRQLLAAA